MCPLVSLLVQDDRADQLKGLARLSAIIAGFSMSSFLEFNFDASTVPLGLLIAYGISTSLVVSLSFICIPIQNP